MNDIAVDGFGKSLGDTVIGIQSLYIYHQLYPHAHIHVTYPNPPLFIAQLYQQASFIYLNKPYPLGTKKIRIDGFLNDSRFNDQSEIDYLLQKLSIDPASIASSAKRNTWLSLMERSKGSKDYILICPDASMKIRTMSDGFYQLILQCIHSYGIATISQKIQREQSVYDLCAVIANAKAIISTDTGVIHIADAFSIPTLAFFSTHNPSLRTMDYPYCSSIKVPSGIALNTEFAQNVEDEIMIEQAWNRYIGLAPQDIAEFLRKNKFI